MNKAGHTVYPCVEEEQAILRNGTDRHEVFYPFQCLLGMVVNEEEWQGAKGHYRYIYIQVKVLKGRHKGSANSIV